MMYRFEGVFNKGEFSGDGLFFFGSLDKYDGEFSQGKLQGRGKMTYRDGHIYVGQVFGIGGLVSKNLFKEDLQSLHTSVKIKGEN